MHDWLEDIHFTKEKAGGGHQTPTVLNMVFVDITYIMYQPKVDVDKLNAVKVVVSWRFER